jgi:hypothetical protein
MYGLQRVTVKLLCELQNTYKHSPRFFEKNRTERRPLFPDPTLEVNTKKGRNGQRVRGREEWCMREDMEGLEVEGREGERERERASIRKG